jgi:methionyl-tRNA formyltransferase
MKSLNIVFMGSPEFAVPSLDLIHQSRHKITAVVSNPDKRRGRRGKPVPTDVKKRALELGLPTIDADDVKSDSFAAKLAGLKPDLLVVVAFRILPVSVLKIPKYGSINLHASLLPKYRGAAPIHWAVINGEKETGATVFFLDERVDTGKIIGRQKTEIGPIETTGDIYERLKNDGAELLLSSIDKIAEGNTDEELQDESLATPAPKLFRENTRIDFTKSCLEVHNLVRGLNPFPTAWCMYGEEKMNIHKTVPYPDKTGKPGKMIREGEKLFAGCGKGCVEIIELQLPGKPRISGQDFANGYDLSATLR